MTHQEKVWFQQSINKSSQQVNWDTLIFSNVSLQLAQREKKHNKAFIYKPI